MASVSFLPILLLAGSHGNISMPPLVIEGPVNCPLNTKYRLWPSKYSVFFKIKYCNVAHRILHSLKGVCPNEFSLINFANWKWGL